MECDVHAESSMALVYNSNGMDMHAQQRHGKHHVTCYEVDATVAGQWMRAQLQNGKHHVTTVEAVVFPGYIKLMAELSLSQYSG
jgi:hypothetical protein